jgi:hypothetical protein
MLFKFEAMDNVGRSFSDTIEAKNEVEAQCSIRQQGYFVTKISKVKPKKDNIKMVYTDALPRNYWKMAFFALFATVLVLWFMSLAAQGQEPTLSNGGNNGLFQEVAITYKGKDYSFHRHSSDYRYKPLHWGKWEQWPMNRKDQNSRSFPIGGLNPNLDQREVSKMMGPAMLKWLDEQQTVSGYYNFTNNPMYDWENFGGDSYGTYSKKKLPFIQTKAGYDFLDLSRFQLPILKGEK